MECLDDVQGKVFRTIGLPKSLEQFIDHVFLTEMPYRQQIKMEVQQELYNKRSLWGTGHRGPRTMARRCYRYA